jgi:hypothetical protein
LGGLAPQDKTGFCPVGQEKTLFVVLLFKKHKIMPEPSADFFITIKKF